MKISRNNKMEHFPILSGNPTLGPEEKKVYGGSSNGIL